MLDLSRCYLKLCECTVIQQYFEENLEKFQYNDYYGFKAHLFPLDIIFFEPLLTKINQRYKIARVGIIKVERNHSYRWHQDSNRGVSINMLLTPDIESFTLFSDCNDVSVDQFEIARLNYEPRTFYLFNNQMMHCVINFDRPRYLFTTEFVADKTQLRFEDVAAIVG